MLSELCPRSEGTETPNDLQVYSPVGLVPVSAVHNTGIQPTVQVTTDIGIVLTCTLDHGWLADREGQMGWIEAKDLAYGEELAVELGDWPRHDSRIFNVPQNIANNYVRETVISSSELGMDIDDDLRFALLGLASFAFQNGSGLVLKGNSKAYKEWSDVFAMKMLRNSRTNQYARNISGSSEVSLPREFSRFFVEKIVGRGENSLHALLCQSTRRSALAWLAALIRLGYLELKHSDCKVQTQAFPVPVARILHLLFLRLGVRAELAISLGTASVVLPTSVLNTNLDKRASPIEKTMVIGVRKGEPQMVFDLTVPNSHSFSACGLVSRNSL